MKLLGSYNRDFSIAPLTCEIVMYLKLQNLAHRKEFKLIKKSTAQEFFLLGSLRWKKRKRNLSQVR